MSDIINHKTEADSVAAIARASVSASPILADSTDLALVFPDKTIKSLEPLRDHPRRKRASVAVMETKSFVDYVKTHKEKGRTTLFGVCKPSEAEIVAFIDYHGEGAGGDPNWGDHTATLIFEISPAWKRWIDADRKVFTQTDFAEFLEDNLLDIVQPPAADLLEVAQLLTGKKGVTFKSGRNLRNGAIDFEYTEQIEAGGGRRDEKLKVPDSFTIGVIPFGGADGVEVTARLRFRISDSGKLSFFFILNRPDKVLETAFASARATIETETGLPVHMGRARIQNPTAI